MRKTSMTRWSSAVALTFLLAVLGAACTGSDEPDAESADAPVEDTESSEADSPTESEEESPSETDAESPSEAPVETANQSAPIGVTLDKAKQTITSALRVDLTSDFATLPLFKGNVGGMTVWYVITDVSDAAIATELGVNHSPKLANVTLKCPLCAQEVTSNGPSPVATIGAL